LEKLVATGCFDDLRDDNKVGPVPQDISISAAGSSAEEQAQRFLEVVHANGYWLASPEENAAVGLAVNWGGLRD
jgi:hypothetical protein